MAASLTLRVQPDNLLLYGGIVECCLNDAQDCLSRNEKQISLLRLYDAEKYADEGLRIDTNNEFLLRLRHQILELKRQIGF